MRRFFAHPTAVIEEENVGEGTRIWHFAHVRRGARIGRNCNIGKCVYVDVEATLGDGVKVQNFVSVYRGATVGDNAFLGPSAVLTNDRYPRSFAESWEPVPTVIEEGASIGANATVVCGVRIGRYAMVGASSVVTRDVPHHGLVYGNPARLMGFVCFCGRRLRRVVKIVRESVVFACDHCGSEVSVDRSDYERMVVESSNR